MMQAELCRCCGKQSALTAEMMAKMAEGMKYRQSFTITDEMRQKLPPEALQDLERMHQRMFARGNQMPAWLRVGFCNMCSRAGCDGVGPCKVPPAYWREMERQLARQQVIGWANVMRAQWLRGEFEDSSNSPVGEWTQVTDDYWIKRADTNRGMATGEAIHDAEGRAWFARVKLLEEPEPLRVGNLTYQGGAGGEITVDANSLEEAQDACLQLLATFSGEGFGSDFLMIGFGTPDEQEPSTDDRKG